MKTKKHISDLLSQYRAQIKRALLCARYGNTTAMKKRLHRASAIEQRIIDAFDEGEKAIAKVNALKDREAIEFLDSLGL